MKILTEIKKLYKFIELPSKIDSLQRSAGRIEKKLNEISAKNVSELKDFEFQVYSQWGEDGIIQYLIGKIEIPNKIFIEFGVEDYRESNTRFLLQNDNWSGLVMDASEKHIQRIKSDPIYWRYNIKAECCFIDRDNINEIIKRNGILGDIGILSVDIDGNDYWIWEAIDCISPRIVICEYDSLLGSAKAVTTPYDRTFHRSSAHYSFLYGGASIKALCILAEKKGYILAGSNSAGLNLFFLRKDIVGDIKPVSPEKAYIKAKFRNSRDENGKLSYLNLDDGRKLIGDLPVFDVEENKEIKIKDLNF